MGGTELGDGQAKPEAAPVIRAFLPVEKTDVDIFVVIESGLHLEEGRTLTCLERVLCYSNSGEGQMTLLMIALGKVWQAKAVLSPGCVVGD